MQTIGPGGAVLERPILHSKLFDLTTHAIAGLVGLGAPAHRFAQDIAAAAAALQAPLAPDRFAASVASRYLEDRQLLMERAVFGARGIASGGLYGGVNKDTAPYLAGAIDKEAKEWSPGFDLLLGLVDSEGAHVYGIGAPGTVYYYDSDGYCALGGGALTARLSMGELGHNPSRSIRDTVYTTFVSAHRAEVTQGVGLGIDMAILDVNGIRRLHPDDIQALEDFHSDNLRAFEERATAGLATLELTVFPKAPAPAPQE